ncbi:MAG: thiamine pyrophosphate-dependent dehydrogenase E1 component subunit alpha [Gemmatimonadetes bacterium]|nr:thiamine pyrophosphate-dependent dehydrogenase E1 component subunit alpha [Gemmatimonadota bacterium]
MTEETNRRRRGKEEAPPAADTEATLAEEAPESAQEGEYETEDVAAAPAEGSKGDFLSEQRRRESLAIDVTRDFPDKYRLSGAMEGCSDEQKLELFERLVKLRLFDARMRKLFRQGRFEGTYYSQIGQEACDAVLTYQMKRDDFVGPSHRDLGAAVGKGVPLKFLTAQVYNRVDSPDGGRYTACHYWHPDYGVMQPATSIMMNWIAATGAAFGYKMLGKDNVAAAFGGDGATAHGDFHEGCNFAGVHRLPIVYVIQNNLWAESLPLHLTSALENLSDRAKAFGFPGVSIDGNDVLAVWNATRAALERARSGEGPTLIEMKTYRWFGHSDIDPADYRSDDEVEAWMAKDPLPRFSAWLEDEGLLDDETLGGVVERVEEEIETAVDFAESSAKPGAETFLSEVYAESYPGFDVRAGR